MGMENIFINYLKVAKGYSEAKALRDFKLLQELEKKNPSMANNYLEETLRFTEMLTLLKEYILNDYSPEKIKISREVFERHFHVIEPNNRGRKPKGYLATINEEPTEDESLFE